MPASSFCKKSSMRLLHSSVRGRLELPCAAMSAHAQHPTVNSVAPEVRPSDVPSARRSLQRDDARRQRRRRPGRSRALSVPRETLKGIPIRSTPAIRRRQTSEPSGLHHSVRRHDQERAGARVVADVIAGEELRLHPTRSRALELPENGHVRRTRRSASSMADPCGAAPPSSRRDRCDIAR